MSTHNSTLNSKVFGLYNMKNYGLHLISILNLDRDRNRESDVI